MDRKPASEISVALCTYNGERFLAQQLESIARQTVLPSELIACDDGSTDATLDILNDFGHKAPFRVEILKNPNNLGSTRNFEQAISRCSGDLIALCDQDDWWVPEKLGVLKTVILSEGCGGVFSDGTLIDEDSRAVGKKLWSSIDFDGKTFRSVKGKEKKISELLRRNVVTGATLLFRADLRNAILPIPRVWIHDGWIAWMMLLHSTLVACENPLIHYRIHRNQQVGTVARPFTDFLRRRKSAGNNIFLSQGDQFQILLDYVTAKVPGISRDLSTRLERKRDFMQYRAELKPNRLSTWAAIVSRAPDYRRYALGARSMIFDGLRSLSGK